MGSLMAKLHFFCSALSVLDRPEDQQERSQIRRILYELVVEAANSDFRCEGCND